MKNLLGLLLAISVGTAPALAQHEVQCSFTSINADITTNTTLSASTLYRVEDCIHVTSGATLTIPAGTVVMFEKASTAGLIVDKGSYLIVQGTAMNPVVFTSDQEPSWRNPGDFSGLLINGEATNNFASNAMTTSTRTCNVNAGGTDDDDSSGSVKFLRIEYAEHGLTLASVGRKTVLENIMVSYPERNAIEFFGGTAQAKRLIAYNAKEADFVFNYGNRSKVQATLGLRLDASANSGTAPFSNGVVIANNDNSPSYSGSPETHPILDKFTLLGPAYCGASGLSSNFRNGVLFHRNAEGGVYHFAISGWPTGLFLDDAPTLANATTNPSILRFEANSFYNNTTNYNHGGSWPSPACASSLGNWVTGSGLCAQQFNQTGSTGFGFDATICSDYCDNNMPSFIMSDDDLDETFYGDIAELNGDPFFVTSDFRGAFDETTDWTATWSLFCPQDEDYCPAEKTLGINSSKTDKINLVVVPNPTNRVAYAEFTTNETGKLTLVVTNSIGQTVHSFTTQATPGKQRIPLTMQGLASGIYNLSVQLPAGTTIQTRFVLNN